MTNYLEVTNLSKSFDSFQLHNISFTLPKGYTVSSSPSLQAPKKRLAIQMAMSLYVFIIYDAFIDEYCDYQPGLFCVISLFTLISASGIGK